MHGRDHQNIVKPLSSNTKKKKKEEENKSSRDLHWAVQKEVNGGCAPIIKVPAAAPLLPHPWYFWSWLWAGRG